MIRKHNHHILFLIAVVSVGCSNNEPVQRERAPRPVTAFQLKKSTPKPTTQLPGSVASWKMEKIGFQVSGRIESVLEPGQNIRGRTVDENNRLISEGTVIAGLERERFELKLAVTEAQKDTAVARAQAKDSELKNLVPQQIIAAEAKVTLTRQEFERIEKLFARDAVAKSDYDQVKASYDTARAELEQSKATSKVTAAELMSLQAEDKEAEENVNQAKKDLSDTLLRSPFHGQIAEVHQIAGGYVQAGEPVVTVQMMDPISVELSVSGEIDTRLNYNDHVFVTLPDSDERLEAYVYEKAAVADPATRTFKVTLLVRNRKIEVGLSDEERKKRPLRIRALRNLFTESYDRSPPYFVAVESLFEDGQGFYVLKSEGWTRENRKNPDRSLQLKLKKVRVVPGEKRVPFLQVATMRELTDIGELKPEMDLLTGAIFLQNGKKLTNAEVNNSIKDGDSIFYVRNQWQLRPGDIVRVDLKNETFEEGFYVPIDLVLEESGKKYVFVVDSTGEVDVAKRMEVKTYETLGTTVRIESLGENELNDELKLVADGALFLTDGEKITVSDVVEEVGRR